MSTAWERVCMARNPIRAKTSDYIENIFTDFIELHGDRKFGDDKSIVAGIGKINDIPVTIIGHQKGKNTKENLERNFGMTSPEGYRKALRIMKQAEKFNRSIITFVDTPGAYPGKEAEERGQGEAIAKNIYEMSNMKVPIITVITGEGFSGGALALAVGDKIIMMENAIYSILSPEGFATILYKDSTKNVEVSEKMKLTAEDLKKLNIIDEIIREPEEGITENSRETFNELKNNIYESLLTMKKLSEEDLLNNRYEKFRKIGGNIIK